MAAATALAARLDNREAEYRVQPHNIEAEQALLGAILVNNDAFYRVSDFLLPEHFFEPVHQRVYELVASMIRAGKIATPITLKTFVNDIDLGEITPSQYLARLAAEATTVINAADYGRTIYDLAIRRQLIGVGEDLVNVAYDAPVEMAPREQIEDAERRLYELAEKGRYEGGFQKFDGALRLAIDMAASAYQRVSAPILPNWDSSLCWSTSVTPMFCTRERRSVLSTASGRSWMRPLARSPSSDSSVTTTPLSTKR